jgi:hypothetical protein
VLFASSRGNAFDRTLLAEQLGVRTIANFSVLFGLLTDHLPTLDFLLRDKAARGERLAAVSSARRHPRRWIWPAERPLRNRGPGRGVRPPPISTIRAAQLPATPNCAGDMDSRPTKK